MRVTYPDVKKLRWASCAFTVALCCAGSLHAQTVPDAGVLERQLREETHRAPVAPRENIQPEIQAETGETLVVKRFIITGTRLVSAKELQDLLVSYVGKEYTFAQLQQVTQHISDYYRKKGYFARAYLPQQDVTSGDVTIQVVEGHLGEVSVNNNAKRANAGYVEHVVTHGMKKGEPLSATRLERGLLLANDLPGVRALGVLSAGDKVGASNLAIKVEDKPLISGDFAANNFGARATDEFQASAGLALNNLSGYGDQATLRALASKNLAYVNAGYSVPIGTDGLRAGITGSYLSYELGDRFQALDAEGKAYTLGVNTRYPFIRSGEKNLWGELAYDFRRYDDDILGIALHRKELNTISAGIDGDFTDGVGQGGFNYYNVKLVAGDVDLSGEPADLAADLAGPKTDGGYAKLNFSFSRDQLMRNNWYARGRFSGQAAMNNLDSSEKFSLGGPYAVRAYPVNEALGDDAAMLNLELHKVIRAWDMFGFVDAGVIRQYHNPWAGWNAGSSVPNHYWLAGVGAGAHYALDKDLRLTGMVALPVGNHAGEPEDGKNQDGSSQAARFWLGLSKIF